MKPTLLTVTRAAELLKASVASVRSWCSQGLLTGATRQLDLAGRPVWQIPLAALESFERPARGWPKGRSRKSA